MSNKESISLWEYRNALLYFPSLNKEQQVDVCIIGAGIAGLTCAYLLTKEGKSVVVLDDGPIGGGQSMRTTGHLSNALDDYYHKIESYFGEKGAKIAAESHTAAIDFIESLVQKYAIECGFSRTTAYLFTAPHESTDILEKELNASHRAGLKEVALIDKAPLTSFDTGPCLAFPHQAQFDVLPYLNALATLIQEQNGQIYTKTHVTGIEEKGVGYTIKTQQAHTVRAKHVVMATNVNIDKYFFPHTKQAAYRSYVIAGEVPKGSVPEGLYYDTLDPYHYVRIAKGSGNFDMLIVGGEDHRTAEKKHIQSCYENLEKWTRERFPMLGKVQHRWSGQIIEPIDFMAFIGREKKGAEKYLITGDSGNGLTHATLGALLITDLIQQRLNPWEELYDPNRITLHATKNFIEENVNTCWQYRDWLKPTDTPLSELKNNCGTVIQEGLKKVACYKDAEGKVHKMTAKCPHLGAVVRWNESEHCWECPAHGSRFDAYGQVLQSPAVSHLEKMS